MPHRQTRETFNRPRVASILQGSHTQFRGYIQRATLLDKERVFDNPFDWTPTRSAALRAPKTALLADAFLTIPDENRDIYLISDPSFHTIGCVLAQMHHDGPETPVSYASLDLPTPSRRWSASERELFAVLHFVT